LDKYSDFGGRAPRSEYWYWTLFIALLVFAGFVAMAIFDALLGDQIGTVVAGILYIFAALGLIVPSLAVTVRRLHDTNSSGWWYLLALIPYLGGTIMFVWCCIKGTNGENRFGPDPLQPDVSDVFS
jgi:uncharacterized membrane protein YhaH (DUF805 family)